MNLKKLWFLTLLVIFCFGKNLLAPDLKLKNCTNVGLSLLILDDERRNFFDMDAGQEFILKGVDREPSVTIKRGKETVAYAKVCLNQNKLLQVFVAKKIAHNASGKARECGNWFSIVCKDY